MQAPYNTLTYDIIGDSQSQEFFDIRADTGSIFVQKALSLTTQTLFTVSAQSLTAGQMTAYGLVTAGQMTAYGLVTGGRILL